MAEIRTRFAPSPTGYLHVGGLRTALYNYLFAKHHGGVFILRLEDTDQARLVPDAADDIDNALLWAGVVPDEAPKKPGGLGPYTQSKRLDIYRKHADMLVQKKQAYYDFHSAEQIAKIKEELKAQNKPLRFEYLNGGLTDADIQNNLEQGKSYVIRLKIPDDPISFQDEIRGTISFPSEQLDDQVLIKSDGFPTYHLANVVDDHLMRISHVIRGDEWLSSTPKHILLYRYFDWELPKFAHLPLLLNPDKSKLSKRQGDVAVADYIKKGYLAEAFVNFIALLGWHPGGDREIFSMEELVETFSLDRIGKSGAVFDLDKLNSINAHYLREMPAEKLAEKLAPVFIEKGLISAQEMKSRWDTYLKIVNAVRTYASTLDDMADAAKVYLQQSLPDYSQGELEKVLIDEKCLETLKAFMDLTEDKEGLDQNEFKAILKTIQKDKGIKGKQLYMPLRIALTGELHGPELHLFTNILSKAERNKRINGLIRYIENKKL